MGGRALTVDLDQPVVLIAEGDEAGGAARQAAQPLLLLGEGTKEVKKMNKGRKKCFRSSQLADQTPTRTRLRPDCDQHSLRQAAHLHARMRLLDRPQQQCCASGQGGQEECAPV